MSELIKAIGKFEKFDELKEFVLKFLDNMDQEYPEQMKLNQVGFQTLADSTDRFHCCSNPNKHSSSWLKLGFKDADYNKLLPELINSVVQDLLNSIPTPLCRLRIMRAVSESFYPVHADPTPRIHIPIFTNDYCSIFYPNLEYVKHMKADGTIYWMDARHSHTAINFGKTDRIHLVASLMDTTFQP